MPLAAGTPTAGAGEARGAPARGPTGLPSPVFARTGSFGKVPKSPASVRFSSAGGSPSAGLFTPTAPSLGSSNRLTRRGSNSQRDVPPTLPRQTSARSPAKEGAPARRTSGFVRESRQPRKARSAVSVKSPLGPGAGGFWDNYADKVQASGSRRGKRAAGTLALFGSMRVLGAHSAKARAEAQTLRDANDAAAVERDALHESVMEHHCRLLRRCSESEADTRSHLVWAYEAMTAAAWQARLATMPPGEPSMRVPDSSVGGSELRSLLQEDISQLRWEMRKLRQESDDDPGGSPLSWSFASTDQLDVVPVGSVHDEAALRAEAEAKASECETELVQAQAQLHRLRAMPTPMPPPPPRSHHASTQLLSVRSDRGELWMLAPEAEGIGAWSPTARFLGSVTECGELKGGGLQMRAGAAEVICMDADDEAVPAAAALCAACDIAPPPPAEPQKPASRRRSRSQPLRNSTSSVVSRSGRASTPHRRQPSARAQRTAAR